MSGRTAMARQGVAAQAEHQDQSARDRDLLQKVLDKPVEYKPFLGTDSITLTARMVMRFLCKPTKKGAVCSADQAVRFVMLCKARGLNPWEGDAYIVGYEADGGPEFSLITAHQAFLKRAEAHDQFDGMESGATVVRAGEIIDLPGDFVREPDTLVGAWARVHRKDRKYPTFRRLKLATFNKGYSRWKSDPAGMIVKCAEADALRSTFPNNLAGMLFAGEVADDEAAPAGKADRVFEQMREALGEPKSPDAEIENQAATAPTDEAYSEQAPREPGAEG